MRNTQAPLSELEHKLMESLWDRGPSTAEECRECLLPERNLKDSTIRTVLRRLEEKGYVTHATDGRTFIYRSAVAPQKAAAQAVRGIVERFCGGSLEQLLVGLVDQRVVNEKELSKIAERIAQAKGERK
jgi:predicted transcriptional regulator